MAKKLIDRAVCSDRQLLLGTNNWQSVLPLKAGLARGRFGEA
jgi:hypothetical protein